MHKFLGHPGINPYLFYSGKFAGYFCGLVPVLGLLRIWQLGALRENWTIYLVLTCLTLGIIFITLGLAYLGSSTRVGLPDESTVLYTNGIYRISRNPIYVGFHFLTIGGFIYAPFWWMACLAIYSIIVYHLIIRSEEGFLIKRFGEAYENYFQQVRRYI